MVACMAGIVEGSLKDQKTRALILSERLAVVPAKTSVRDDPDVVAAPGQSSAGTPPVHATADSAPGQTQQCHNPAASVRMVGPGDAEEANAKISKAVVVVISSFVNCASVEAVPCTGD